METIVNVNRDGATYRPTLDYMNEFESYGHAVTWFDPSTLSERVQYVPYKLWSDSEYAIEDQEAVADWKAYATKKAAAYRLISRIEERLESLSAIRFGSNVEVFKGRKVPKGIYQVTHSGMGQWGSYLNLRDAKGTEYRYISPDNCRAVFSDDDRRKIVVEECSDRTELWEFVYSMADGRADDTQMLIFCDFLEEGGWGDDYSDYGIIYRQGLDRDNRNREYMNGMATMRA